MHIIIVEDTGHRNFLPLTATRPVFGLLCGSITLADRIKQVFKPNNVSYLFREDLHKFYSEQNPNTILYDTVTKPALYINGRVLASDALMKLIKKTTRAENRNTLFRNDTDWIALYVTEGELPDEYILSLTAQQEIDGYLIKKIEARCASYPWDIIGMNGECIAEDFTNRSKSSKKKIQGKIHNNSVLTRKSDILIGNGTVIHPFVVVDASKGPVIIESDVTVEPHTYLVGPLWINSKTVIKAGARIYGGTSIGYNCRAGGEISSSIIHAYTNKSHEGFLGHSYLGEWINIGADTNNSNLKNDYGPIRVMINGNPVDSGKQFFGMVMGDHSRTGINTMINTGSVIGVACNVFGANFPPKLIPDFSWGGSDFLRVYQFEKFLQNARAMTARRGVTMSEDEISLLQKLYESRQKK